MEKLLVFQRFACSNDPAFSSSADKLGGCQHATMDGCGVDLWTVAWLRSRPDRIAAFRARIPLDAGVTVVEFPQDKNPHGGRTGCFAAHIAMWAHGERVGAGPQGCFEDDAMPTAAGLDPAQRALGKAALQQIQRMDPDFDIIALGGLPLTWSRGSSETSIPGVLRAPFLEAHAYVISPAFRRRVLQGPYYGGADTWLARMAQRSYCILPELFCQDDACGSNNDVPIELFLSVRSCYKAYAHRARELCGRVPLGVVQGVTLGALALGGAWALQRPHSKKSENSSGSSGNPRPNRALFFLFVVLFVVVAFATAVDGGIQSLAIKDAARQPIVPLLSREGNPVQ
jgi:hypothetical protein